MAEQFSNSSKADKAQGAWIDATLVNGWTGFGTKAGLKYAKNDMGVVFITLSATSGTVTANTAIATLPPGYRPLVATAMLIYNLSDATVAGRAVVIYEDGNIKVPDVSLTTGKVYVGTFSYCVS